MAFLLGFWIVFWFMAVIFAHSGIVGVMLLCIVLGIAHAIIRAIVGTCRLYTTVVERQRDKRVAYLANLTPEQRDREIRQRYEAAQRAIRREENRLTKKPAFKYWFSAASAFVLIAAVVAGYSVR